MRVMNIPNLESGLLSRQSPWTHGREPTFVSKLGQWVRLIHELRQLRASEKLPYGDRHGADVDQANRCSALWTENTHPLLDSSLEPQEADAELLLYQETYCLSPSIA